MKHSFVVDFPASTACNISYTSTLFPPFFQLNRCGLSSFRAGFRDSRFSVPKSHVVSRVFPSQQEGCCCFFFAINNKNRKFQVLSLENKPSYWPDSVYVPLFHHALGIIWRITNSVAVVLHQSKHHRKDDLIIF